MEILPIASASLFALYLSLIDIRELRIPNRILIWGFIVTIAAMILAGLAISDPTRILQALGGGAISIASFFLLHLVKPSGLGMGDVKFAGLIGGALSWIAFPIGLIGLAIAFVASALFAIISFSIFRSSMKRVIPFAPFMAFGLYFTAIGLLL